MRSQTLLTIASLPLFAYAHPLFSSRQNIQRQRRNPQTFSVVNVDGSSGSETTSSSTPTTMIETVTAAAPTATETEWRTQTDEASPATETLTTTLVL
jgi:hypothetical protein